MAVTFHASSSVPCVSGISNRQHIHLELWRIRFVPDYEQHLITVTHNITTHADGSFHACFNQTVRPGMALDAVDNDHNAHVSWFIPTMSMRIARVTDVVHGTINAGVPSYDVDPGYTLTVRVHQCSVISIGGPCPRVVKRSVTPDSAGLYRTDLTDAYDLRGGDTVSLTYESTAAFPGDTYEFEQWTPFMSVTVGDKDIIGYVNPKQTATFELRDHGVLISSVTATGVNQGQIGAVFSQYPADGYLVSSDFASDASLRIPNTDTTFPISSNGNQKIKTNCFPGLPLSISWQGGGTGYAILTADSQGRATLDLATQVAPGFHLAHNSVVRVYCIADTGDIVGHGHLVP